jgi:DNA repair exonuclease SbcCD nuclease subunit
VAHGVNKSDTSIYQTELEGNTTFVLNRLKECAAGLPLFIAIGNHDAEEHTPSFLYNKFTALSNSENTVFGDSTEYGGYCYRDFDDKRVRVYLLNAGEEIVKSGNDSGATEV